MKKNLFSLQTKISIMITGVLFVSIFFILPFLSNWIDDEIHDKTKINILNIAKTVASSPFIKTKLITGDPQGDIQLYISDLMKTLKNIEFIVIADMSGIRYSHPNPHRLGEKFRGGDEKRVLDTGETYVSQGEGTLGVSSRAFTPIYTDDGSQIGFVSVGTLEENINHATKNALFNLSLFILIGFMIGTIGTIFLASSIKRSLLGLEPEEIAKLYTDKIGMLEAINEGLIAIDDKERITLINEAALKIIQLDDKYTKDDLLGKNVYEFFDTTQLPYILDSGEAEYDQELIINNTIILANRVPIKNKNKIIGAIATFRDKTEFTNLAEEVTGVKQVLEALRANTHEFSNKLHVILGLLHLGEIEEAKKYIKSVSENQEEVLSMVTGKIKDPTIAGLILGKISRAKELGIDLEIDEDSYFKNEKDHRISNHALITILGNLLENAFEAVSKTSKTKKNISLKLQETDENIEIYIEDNGTGIPQENLDKIFDRGYTTKTNSKGVGLNLVDKVIKNLNGNIIVTSTPDTGTYFNIIIPKEDKCND